MISRKRMTFLSYLITPTCKLDGGSNIRGCWDGLSHTNKLKIVYILYKSLKPFLYSFGMVFPWFMKCMHLIFPQLYTGIDIKYN